MNVLLVTLGTRGDVQPFVVLARRLIAAGHDATVAASASFADLAAGYDVPFRPLDLDFTELKESADAGAVMRGDLAAVVEAVRSIKPLFRASLDDQTDAVAEVGPDVLLTHPKTLGGPHLARWRGIPHANALVVPGFSRTGAFPPIPLTWERTPAWVNRAAYTMIPLGMRWFKGIVAEWRHETLGQAGTTRLWDGGHPTLYGYSPQVVPNPHDWPDTTRAVGYWLPDANVGGTPDPEIRTFIEAGDRPVSIGFGSSVDDDPAALGRLVSEAVDQAGVRAVVHVDPSVIELDRSSRIHPTSEAPHGWLFPQMDCIVHHGGSGTTAEALRSGRPQVVVPFSVDQPFWARRMAALGVAVEPLPRRRLTAERLADALVEAWDRTDIRDAAATLADAINREDGVGQAVAYIEHMVDTGR